MSKKSSSGIGKDKRVRRGNGKTTSPRVVSVPQAKTIEEANAFAVQFGLAKHADFGKTDISVANDVLASLAEHRSDFSQMPVLEFVGTMPEYRTYIKNTYGYQVPAYKNYFAMAFEGNYKTGSGPAIVLNAQSVLPKNMPKTQSNISHSLSSRFLSTGTIKGMINHEMGHQLAYFVDGASDSVLSSLYTQYRGKSTYHFDPSGKISYTSKMAHALSNYANTNIGEFIAEGWAEYRTSSKPRPLAQQIGQRLEELYGGSK